MRINFLTIIFLIIISFFGVSGYLYYQKNKEGIQTFDSSLIVEGTKEVDTEAVDDLKDFLYENKGKFVHLSVILSSDMKNNILKGMDRDGRIIFEAPDGEDKSKKIKYLIRLPDDGRKNFLFDKLSGKLDGYFKTFRRVDKRGNPIINLVPINPKYLTK